MLQATSVRVQATNVKCKIFEWTTIIVSEKHLKLQVWRFKLQVWKIEFLSLWMTECEGLEWVG